MKMKKVVSKLVIMTALVVGAVSCNSDNGYGTSESVNNDEGGGYGEGGSTQNIVKMTVDNDGAQAFFVSSITGDEQPTSLNTNNSTWTLTEGTRYELTIVNSGSHPFQIRNSNNNKLLSQNSEGTFESDSGVNFVDDGQQFYFTLTPELTAEISTYFCGIHTGMNGAINVD